MKLLKFNKEKLSEKEELALYLKQLNLFSSKRLIKKNGCASLFEVKELLFECWFKNLNLKQIFSLFTDIESMNTDLLHYKRIFKEVLKENSHRNLKYFFLNAGLIIFLDNKFLVYLKTTKMAVQMLSKKELEEKKDLIFSVNLMPIKQFVKENYFISEIKLKYLIFHNKHNFNKLITKMDKNTVLIDRVGFEWWLNNLSTKQVLDLFDEEIDKKVGENVK